MRQKALRRLVVDSCTVSIMWDLLLLHTEVPRVGCHAPTVGTYGKLRQPHIEVLQAYDRPSDRGSTAPYNSGSTRLAQGPP